MISSFLLAQAAAPDPMAAFKAPGFIKGVGMFLLIAVAAAVLLWPVLMKNLKSSLAETIETVVETKVNALVPGLGTGLKSGLDAGEALLANVAQRLDTTNAATASVVNPPQTRTVPDVTSMVQQRAVALKSACPNAPEALRLRWLEEGYDPAKAQADYIGVLESTLSSRNAVVSNAVSPAPTPAPSGPAVPPTV